MTCPNLLHPPGGLGAFWEQINERDVRQSPLLRVKQGRLPRVSSVRTHQQRRQGGMVNQERRDKLERAVNHVRACRSQGIQVSVRACARKFEVKESTLRMRLKGGSSTLSHHGRSPSGPLPPIDLRNTPSNRVEFKVFRRAVQQEIGSLEADGRIDRRLAAVLNAVQNMMDYMQDGLSAVQMTIPGVREMTEHEAYMRLAVQRQTPPLDPTANASEQSATFVAPNDRPLHTPRPSRPVRPGPSSAGFSEGPQPGAGGGPNLTFPNASQRGNGL